LQAIAQSTITADSRAQGQALNAQRNQQMSVLHWVLRTTTVEPDSFTAVLWKSKGRAHRRFQLANRTGHLDHPFAAQFTVRSDNATISNLRWG
jgi:hypothetical protein